MANDGIREYTKRVPINLRAVERRICDVEKIFVLLWEQFFALQIMSFKTKKNIELPRKNFLFLPIILLNIIIGLIFTMKISKTKYIYLCLVSQIGTCLEYFTKKKLDLDFREEVCLRIEADDREVEGGIKS